VPALIIRPVTTYWRNLLGIRAMSVVTEKGKVEIASSPESLEKLVDALEGRP
jgi:hypothetical protein